MDFKDYQQLASRTLLAEPDFQIQPDQVLLAWNALGLVGEAGEVAELVKKGVFHQRGLDLDKMRKELGDVLWYVAAVASNVGLTLDEIAWHNLEKLQARFPDGWDAERSTHKTGTAA